MPSAESIRASRRRPRSQDIMSTSNTNNGFVGEINQSRITSESDDSTQMENHKRRSDHLPINSEHAKRRRVDESNSVPLSSSLMKNGHEQQDLLESFDNVVDLVTKIVDFLRTTYLWSWHIVIRHIFWLLEVNCFSGIVSVKFISNYFNGWARNPLLKLLFLIKPSRISFNGTIYSWNHAF